MDPPTTAPSPPPFDELRREDENLQNDCLDVLSVPVLTFEEPRRRVENVPLAEPILPRFKDQVNDLTLHVNATPFPQRHHPIPAQQHPPSPPIGPASVSSAGTNEFVLVEVPVDVINIPAVTPFADVRLLTHSVLLTNPQALHAMPSHEAFPIDPSVLTTGFAENQFPDQATRRPAFVCVTVTKPYADATLGINVAQDGASGAVYISGFKGDRDLSRVIALSPLGVGDKLLMVNGQTCAGRTPTEVARLIHRASGKITIAIENVSGDPSLVETMVEKDTPDTKVGLGFNYAFSDGGFVRVSSVSGLFANSFVEVGDRVVFVNGEKPRNAIEAKDLVARSPRFVSLTVESRTGVVLPVSEDSNTAGEPNAPRERKVPDAMPMPTTEAASCSCCIM